METARTVLPKSHLGISKETRARETHLLPFFVFQTTTSWSRCWTATRRARRSEAGARGACPGPKHCRNADQMFGSGEQVKATPSW